MRQLRPTLNNNCVLQPSGFNRLAVVLEDLGREGGLQDKGSRTRLGTAGRDEKCLAECEHTLIGRLLTQ